MMNVRSILAVILLSIPIALNAQSERKHIREGVKAYDNKTWSESEIDFRKALDTDSTSVPAKYDAGNALYKQEKYKDASKIFEQLAANTSDLDDTTLADVYHNLGNSLLKQGDFARSIDAYKNALRIRPGDNETRYNLVYAQAKLKEQQQKQNQQKKNQDNKNQDKNKKDQQKNKDKQDQQNKQQQNKEQQNKQQQDKQQQNKSQDQKKQKQQAAQPQKQLSKEEIQKMLQAIQQQELKTLKKYEKVKAKAKNVKTEKDW